MPRRQLHKHRLWGRSGLRELSESGCGRTIGCMNCRQCLFSAILLCSIGLARLSFAQQEYSLTEDDSWTLVSEADPATPKGQLALARQALARSDASRAVEMTTQWIDAHERHALLPDAYLLRGDAKFAQRNYYNALFDYEFIARGYPASDVFVAALEREYEIARLFATGTKRKLWGMRIVDATDTAEELLIRVQERLGGSQLAERAGMTLADFYFNRREMTLAAEAYELFIENYPRSEQIDKARQRLIASNLALFKGPEFDAAGLYEARLRLQELKRVDPVTADQMGADAILTRIDESDAEKMLTEARWYLKIGDPISAEFVIRKLIKRYPYSVATVRALRLIPDVVDNVPEHILIDAPDYAAYRDAILGSDEAATDDAAMQDADSQELP